MPTISMFRGIKISIFWSDHTPPHIHAEYSGQEVLVDIQKIAVLKGNIEHKQLQMVLGWVALHQSELLDNWQLAQNHQEPFAIEPLK